LFVAEPVRLARLSVPRLDETGQETELPKGSFKSHPRIRIQPFPLPCKHFMSGRIQKFSSSLQISQISADFSAAI
jgi:hypothetical protein